MYYTITVGGHKLRGHPVLKAQPAITVGFIEYTPNILAPKALSKFRFTEWFVKIAIYKILKGSIVCLSKQAKASNI